MKSYFALFAFSGLMALALWGVSCAPDVSQSRGNWSGGQWSNGNRGDSTRIGVSSLGASAETAAARREMASTPIRQFSSLSAYRSSINLQRKILPLGRHGRVRPARPMNPRYITIHATANPNGSANDHARALYNGALRARKRPGRNRIGYLIWHFTVDAGKAYQHLPVNEQGEHADFSGPGNRSSIGVEMCEKRGDDLGETIDRTARLTAWLMVENNIPLGGVVPHYHWPRSGLDKPNKPCPRWLLDYGRPGPTWRQFMQRVRAYELQLRRLRGGY